MFTPPPPSSTHASGRSGHTFATWAIEDGVPLWQLATIMGTSVVQIEDT
jgi:hypothetical protein